MKPKLTRRPLYRQVEAAIRKEILEGKSPGDVLPPEPELAELFSVSLVTVRQALAELAKEQLIVRQRGRRTCVAPKPPSRKHVGVLLETDISAKGLAPYYATFLQQLRIALDKTGLRGRPYLGYRPLNIIRRGLDCADLRDDINLDRISGIIRIGGEKDEDTLRMYAEKGIPYLDQNFLEERHPETFATVLIRKALGYLKERGRSRLAVLAWDDRYDSRAPLFSELLSREAHAFGFELYSHWMDFDANATMRGMGWERFRDIWRARRIKPDSLIVWDDMLFLDCQTAIMNMGIQVPNDLDVVAFRSDAVTFNPKFPVYVGCSTLSELAMVYANRIKQLIEGIEDAAVPEWSWPISWRLEGESSQDILNPDNKADPLPMVKQELP